MSKNVIPRKASTRLSSHRSQQTWLDLLLVKMLDSPHRRIERLARLANGQPPHGLPRSTGSSGGFAIASFLGLKARYQCGKLFGAARHVF
ncbi:hypothetical protein B5P45_14295 [Phyllobacterium zundukense]|uniref:Uncharacterized protein n=1 Tax=Phyllobacterium zundukense TaxID=1867719 RepID=A0A2N9VXH1_9HYPH|nr:hypothetical protein BLM14_03340 [Phyllobacterium zundukense]PIO44189.1 hypothetical protein B5P45_14295 [Phyllobacterium zundukense]